MPLLPTGIAWKGTQGNFCHGGKVLYSVFFGDYHEHIKLKIHSPENVRSAVLVVQSLSHIQLFAIQWTIACQAPMSMGFPRQAHWNGLPVPSLGDLPESGIEPKSSALAGGFFIL